MPRTSEPKPTRTLETWESWADKAIRDAQERGDFTDLPGEGRPLRVDRNPLAGDRELGFHVLKNAEVLPRWMELAREASDAAAALATLEERSRERIAQLRARACRPTSPREDTSRPAVLRWLRGGFPEWRSDPDSVTVAGVERERQHLRARYLERAAELDQKIKTYNDELPSDLRWLERPRVAPATAAARFDIACPPVMCSTAAAG